ncbi:MAG: paraquat-inducible protein A [Ideonella sp.]
MTLLPAGVAHCERCDAVIARGHRLGADALLALTLAALVVFLIANGAELITIRLRGTEVATTLPMAIIAAWRDGAPVVAILATLTAIVAPLVVIVLRLLILVPLALGRVPEAMGWYFRILHESTRWNTVPVLGVGALLSLVRMSDLAQASAGPGLVAIGTLAVLLAAIESAGLQHLWPVQHETV